MSIKNIGRRVEKLVIRMAGSGCGCGRESGSCGGCGSHNPRQTIEPGDGKSDSVSKEAKR